MPITGRSPRACFDQFEEHLRPLVAEILGPRRHLGRIYTRDSVLQLSFRERGLVAVPIDTRKGTLYFYLAQELHAARERPRRYRLETRRYWYRILEEPDWRAQALLRWEYDRGAGQRDPSRHHFQAAGRAAGGSTELDLGRLHIPTGWVLIEEIFRFLIVDLSMAPACGDRWPDVLTEGERRFFEDFTSKRHSSGSA